MSLFPTHSLARDNLERQFILVELVIGDGEAAIAGGCCNLRVTKVCQ